MLVVDKFTRYILLLDLHLDQQILEIVLDQGYTRGLLRVTACFGKLNQLDHE